MFETVARSHRRRGTMHTEPLGRGLPHAQNGTCGNCHPHRRKRRGFLRPLGSFSRDGFGGFLPQPLYFSGGPRRGFTLGCPPIGRLHESILVLPHSKKQEGLISPASKAEACRPSSVRREEAPLDGEDRSEIMCQKEMACWIPIWPAQPRILFPAISKEQTDCPHSAGHCDTPRQSLLRYSYSQIGTVTSARTKSVRN